MDWTEVEKFRMIVSGKMKVNWPHSNGKIFNMVSRTGIALTEGFERHIRRLENWTLDKSVADELPYLSSAPAAE